MTDGAAWTLGRSSNHIFGFLSSRPRNTELVTKGYAPAGVTMYAERVHQFRQAGKRPNGLGVLLAERQNHDARSPPNITESGPSSFRSFRTPEALRRDIFVSRQHVTSSTPRTAGGSGTVLPPPTKASGPVTVDINHLSKLRLN